MPRSLKNIIEQAVRNQTQRNKNAELARALIEIISRGTLGLGRGVKPEGKELAILRGGSRKRTRRRRRV